MLGTLLRLAATRLLPRRDVAGVRVIVADPSVSREVVFDRVRSALELLMEVDLRRHRLVCRYVKQVFVWPGPYDAFIRSGGVLLASDTAINASTTELVGTLVHEAVHIRVHRLGVRYVGSRKARIERRCVAEEVDCLLRAQLIGKATAELMQVTLATEWWASERALEQAKLVVQKAGLPTWSARLFMPLSSPFRSRSTRR